MEHVTFESLPLVTWQRWCQLCRTAGRAHGGEMYGLADLYGRGQHLEAWTAALAVGNLPTGTGTGREFDRLASETMRRVRANLEVLVDGLLAVGWQFHAPIPLADPTADIATDLDEFEGVVGRFPRSLRAFAEQVGQVNLNGHLPGWGVLTPSWLAGVGREVRDLAS